MSLGARAVNLFSLCPFPDVPVGPVVWKLSQICEFMTPKSPCPSRIKGLILAHVHSQMNMHTCAKVVPDRSSCLASFPHFLMCAPPQCPLGFEGLLFLAYVHSLMNLYTCATVGPDRSSGLEAFPDLLSDDPLTPMPLPYQGVHFALTSIPRLICTRVQNLVPIGPDVWHLSPIC